MGNIKSMLVGAAVLASGLAFAGNASAAPQRPVAPAAQQAYVVPAGMREVPSKFQRTKVRFRTNEPAGTIIVNTNTKFLYFVQGNGRAIRYGVGVGRQGFGWSGVMHVGRKQEWPSWTPPKEMVVRERRYGHNIPLFMRGGPNNPLGARALYLYRNGHDSMFRIHGTNQPWSIGKNMSSGCIRMMNANVKDLYSRASVGTKVVVIGPGNRQGNVEYTDNGVDILHTLFGG